MLNSAASIHPNVVEENPIADAAVPQIPKLALLLADVRGGADLDGTI
jgi:hypothetical protein